MKKLFFSVFLFAFSGIIFGQSAIMKATFPKIDTYNRVSEYEFSRTMKLVLPQKNWEILSLKMTFSKPHGKSTSLVFKNAKIKTNPKAWNIPAGSSVVFSEIKVKNTKGKLLDMEDESITIVNDVLISTFPEINLSNEVGKEVLLSKNKLLMKDTTMKIISFKMSTATKEESIALKSESPNLSKDMKMAIKSVEEGEKIYFEEIIGQRLDGTTVDLGIFYLKLTPVISENQSLKVTIKAKLFKGEGAKTPVSSQAIFLKDEKDLTLQTTTTNEYGDFSFENVDKQKRHFLELAPNPELKNEKVFLAKQNGKIVGSFITNKEGLFRYDFLPLDFQKIEIVEEADVKIDLYSFVRTKEKEITVLDNIYYETNKWDIGPQAAERLAKVVAALIENTKVNLEIYAHTDSRGEIPANMELSEKRAKSAAEYIISKGIAHSRLSSKGFGESKIINRCTDGVNCSEKEHELNRRTEFRFVKE